MQLQSLAYEPSIQDLNATGARQAALHQGASDLAVSRFGRSVFIRAVVEVSNYCRENCRYCGMRRDNRALSRARAQHDELAELLIHHRPAAVTDVNLQSGEDPVAARQVVLPLVRTLRRETNLGISVCLGTLNFGLYHELRQAGAASYILKFEVADPREYSQQEAPGTLRERLNHIRWLASHDWNVSSGFIAGLPDHDLGRLQRNCELAAALPVRGCSVSPFVPGEATPLASVAPGDVETTLNSIAVLRVMRPDWVIPAVSALARSPGADGYRRALCAGANLVTINLTPPRMRGDYLIYSRGRPIMSEARVLEAIAAAGLTPSAQSLAAYYGNGGTHATSVRAVPATIPPDHGQQSASH